MDNRTPRQHSHSHAHSRRPAHLSPAATTSSSTFPTDGNAAYPGIPFLNATVTQQSPTMLQNAQGGLVSAPLPSPSGAQPMSYFSSLGGQGPSAAQQQGGPQSQQYAQVQQAQQQQYQYQQQVQQQPSSLQPPGTSSLGVSEGYVGQRGGGGGAPETASFLKDFNLVAEAAKRAQMACLTRDLGDVGL